MAWYATGTISIATNGNAVTGTGTQFLGNVRVGDGFVIQGSNEMHEVVGISSNTQLTIAPVYTGSGGGGKQYRAVPVLGYDKDLSDAFNQIRLQWGQQLASLGDWATAATATEALQDLGFTSIGTALATAATAAEARSAIGAGTGNATIGTGTGQVRTNAQNDIRYMEGMPNVVIKYTTKGQPCFFYKLAAFNCEDIAPGGELGTGLHPAFISNGVARPYILVGMYPAALVDGELVSQPGRDPVASRTYDQELALAAATGPGFEVASNWDYAAIALWCMANSYQPLGNTNWGRSHAKRWETAQRIDGAAPGGDTGTGRTITGTGPASWSHNGGVGITDLVGNVWGRCTGLKLIENVFYLAPDNGTYAESNYIATAEAPAAGWFSTRPTSVDPAHDIMLRRALAIPASAALAPLGYFWKQPDGERIPLRGGGFGIGGGAGLGALHLSSARSRAGADDGCRLRFRDQ